MKRIACLTPLPPVQSGIAAYAVMMLREWAKACDVTAVVAQDEVTDSGGVPVLRFEEFVARRDEFDAVYCQIGNNPHHEVFYRYAMAQPSIVVLHDLVLHHLIVEMTLARGDVEGYVAALRANHGEAGAAWARGRAAGLHDEIGNFLFPASMELARRSSHVIVHNHYAREVLLRHGVDTPVTVTGHPLPSIGTHDDARQSLRAAHGFSNEHTVIAMFGFVTAAKRPRVVFEAFGRALRHDDRLRLLVVGQPAPDTSLQQLAADADIPDSFWQSTGYVSDDDFVRYLAAADRVVNLRYPSAGETSGPLIHVLAAGKEIAVSDYGPFASLPSGVAVRIPLGEGELDALVAFMIAEGRTTDRAEQLRWLEEWCDTPRIVRDYMSAAAAAAAAPAHGDATPATPRELPLFAAWRLEESVKLSDGRLRLTLRNTGSVLVANPLFGEPAARFVAKFVTADGEVIADTWLRPAGDVEPGASISVDVTSPPRAKRLTLAAAMEGVAIVDDTPFATLELA